MTKEPLPEENLREELHNEAIYPGQSGSQNRPASSQSMTGYLHPDYAESLSEFGTPRELPRCGGWILERPIPGFPYRDAMGCYPLFTCPNWQQLHHDLDALGNDLVSLAIVTDPFGTYNKEYLRKCFGDVSQPFKEHFVVKLGLPTGKFVSKHHRYYARRSLEQVHVEKCNSPLDFLRDWADLYGTLVARHNINGIQAFSSSAFAKQLKIPGLVMFRAVAKDRIVGAHLWYFQGKVAYSHLAAFSPLGYELMASYALYWSAMEYFANKARWLDLGAGTGVTGDATDGLSRFKRGWSTGTRTAYFCGRIFDRARYAEIVQARRVKDTDYFPAYRRGEFT